MTITCSMTAVIGITGGIGSGKSAVARLLAEAGAVVLDADALARAALATPEVVAAVTAAFGAEVAPDGVIRPAALAARVFGEGREDARRTLEAIVHPPVRAALRRELDEARATGARLVVLDVPLLLESGWRAECDVVLHVEAPEADRAARAAARGWPAGELARREAAQTSLAAKKAAATHVIRNDGDLDRLRERTLAVLRDVL